VLLSDANEQLAEVYRYFLARQGHAVEVAHGELDCLMRLRLNRPEVLVLDLDLIQSGWSGVLVWLRALEQDTAPAVLLTGTDATDLLAAMSIPPVVGCLHKPFDLHVLGDCVRAATKAAPVWVVQ
jgi:DNA-binding response OmpR family regulator